MGVHGNLGLTELLLKRYMNGQKENFTEEENELMKPVEEALNGWSPYYLGRQWCRDLFIHTTFEDENEVAWSDLAFQWEYDLGPYYFGTDFGTCCFLSAHLNLDKNSSGYPDYHSLDARAKHGETKGLSVLFDIEQFNYGFTRGKGAGLKMALHDHRDKPMMQFSSQFIQAGSETQINMRPSISFTTEEAIEGLNPDERKCNVEFENNLTALSYDGGFRYEMNNCLVDEGLLRIYWNCRCFPLFSTYDSYMDFLGPCKDKSLYCAREITKGMGFLSANNTDSDFAVQEALDNPDMIGNISKPEAKTCRPRCDTQENYNIMSPVQFPPNQGFFSQPIFCYVASHILQVSCKNEYRKYFLELSYPEICNVLKDHERYFGELASCKDWPGSYYGENDQENDTLTKEVLDYGRTNLALTHIFFQSPYITKMKRDLTMTFTDFVANSGGLIGLYVGFSFVSIFEMIYWCCQCFSKSRKKVFNF